MSYRLNLMRVSVHRELMKDCINNGDFAKNTGAGAYDTLSKNTSKCLSLRQINSCIMYSVNLIKEMREGQSVFCYLTDMFKV